MIDDHIRETLRGLGVSVRYADLPDDRDGEYHHERRLVRLQTGMSHRLHRSVIAHECAHAYFGDVLSGDDIADDKMERRADIWAAVRLIDIDHYRRAESLHHGHVEAIALELDVTVDLVESFRSVLARHGDTVYLRPRMGVGMWLHRGRA